MTKSHKYKKYILAAIITLAMPFVAVAENPYLKANNTWISISGSVTGVPTPDAFILNYGQGTVSEVNGREFTLNTGLRKITVDTVGMLYNPMDDDGFQKIEKGDVVSVTGTMETDILNDRKLSADSVVTLLNKESEE